MSRSYSIYYLYNFLDPTDPIRRICKEFNKLYRLIDFSLSVNVIKNNVIIYLNL